MTNMTNINKTAIAGTIFFTLILAGFVAIKVDQTTIALLGGAFIGIVIAAVTTTLIVVIGLRKPDAPAQPAQSEHEISLLTTTNHYHDQRRVVVVVNVPANTPASEQRFIVARELRVLPKQAQRMIDAGEVKCLSDGSAYRKP